MIGRLANRVASFAPQRHGRLFVFSALLYWRIAHFREDLEQEDRGDREGLGLVPPFPAFLFNPDCSLLVAAPPRCVLLRPKTEQVGAKERKEQKVLSPV